jgi:hypothetical protein
MRSFYQRTCACFLSDCTECERGDKFSCGIGFGGGAHLINWRTGRIYLLRNTAADEFYVARCLCIHLLLPHAASIYRLLSMENHTNGAGSHPLRRRPLVIDIDSVSLGLYQIKHC